MKTRKQTRMMPKTGANAFDKALIRLGHHFAPRPELILPSPSGKKS